MVSFTRSLSFIAAAALCLIKSASAQTYCTTAPSTAGDRRPDQTVLKYATYNAEFLFLTGYGSLDCPGDDCKWATATAAQNHVKQVATIIKAMNADIVQVTEVEDCTALKAVITQLVLLGDSTYAAYIVKGTDTATGQNVGFLTRVDPTSTVLRTSASVSLPVSNSTCPSASGYPAKKSVSKNIYATFKPTGFSKAITAIGVHFLARPDDKRRCFEREGQATVISNLAVSQVSAGNHVIISGDINDWSRQAPDRNSNAPISNVLGLLERSGFSNAGAIATKTSRYTQWYDRNNDCRYALTEVSSLDHIIVSNSLRSAITDVSFRNDLYTASCSGYNSDHYPITVTFRAA